MRRAVVTLLTLLLLAALAFVVTGHLTDERVGAALTLDEVVGQVAVRGLDAREVPGQAGARLGVDDRVITGAGSRAVLALGPETRIRVEPESSVQVLSVDPDEVRLELEGGRLHASVRPNSAAVRVGVGERGVAATNAVFTFGRGVDGTLGIELVEGDLMTQHLGDAGRLTAPTRVMVTPDGHAEVGAIAETLDLQLAWPEGRKRSARERDVTLNGRTTPGARVTVTGGERPVETQADGSGSFSATVRLLDGARPIRVRAVDVLGKEASTEAEFEVKPGIHVFGGGASYEPPQRPAPGR
jgi:hypothetical protein